SGVGDAGSGGASPISGVTVASIIPSKSGGAVTKVGVASCFGGGSVICGVGDAGSGVGERTPIGATASGATCCGVKVSVGSGVHVGIGVSVGRGVFVSVGNGVSVGGRVLVELGV